jgi:hypothetical protein
VNRHDRRKRLVSDRREIAVALRRMLLVGYALRLFGREVEEMGLLEYAACASCSTKQTGLNVTRTAITWTDHDQAVLFYTFAFACKPCLGDADKVKELATRLIVEPIALTRSSP